MAPSAEQVMFAHVVGRPDSDIELDVAALLIGDWEFEIDIPSYRRRIDDFAAAAGRRLETQVGEPFGLIRAINRTLFGELSFRGDEETYYDPRNSFLHQVIDRRLGIPISLSVLYMEVARRLGSVVEGISFPGHFLLRYDEDDQFLIFDPFHMGLSLDYDDLRALLERSTRGQGQGQAGSKPELSDDMIEPATKREILGRMLANLASIYNRNGDPVRCTEVLERMAILDPDSDRIDRELEKMRRRARELN